MDKSLILKQKRFGLEYYLVIFRGCLVGQFWSEEMAKTVLNQHVIKFHRELLKSGSYLADDSEVI